MRCANCNGSHTANYSGCVKIQKAKEIEHIRSHERLSYRDALRLVKERNIRLTNNAHNNAIITKAIVPNNTTKRFNNTRTVETQTENTQLNQNQNNILVQVSIMMLKMLKLSKESDFLEHPSTSIEIMLKMLGIQVTETEINKLLEPESFTDKNIDNEISESSQKNKKGKLNAASQITQSTFNSHQNQKIDGSPKQM